MLAFFLMPANWTLEVIKWHVATKPFYTLSSKQITKAILAGIALDMFFPFRTGDATAKILIAPNKMKFLTFFLQIYVSLAQLIAIALFAAFNLLFLFFAHPSAFQNPVLLGSAAIALPSLLILMLLYFSPALHFILQKISLSIPKLFNESYRTFQLHLKQKISILILSFCRYLIYTVQFIIILNGMETHLNQFFALSFVSLLLLFITIVPQFTLTEGVTRTAIAISIAHALSPFYLLDNTITNSSMLILANMTWFINLFIPAIAGMFFYRKIF